MIDGVDYDRGTLVAGNRGYYLKGSAVQMNIALINFGLDFLQKKGYIPIQTPYFMEKESMAKVAQLEQFDEELYTVRAGPPRVAAAVCTAFPRHSPHGEVYLRPPRLTRRRPRGPLCAALYRWVARA